MEVWKDIPGYEGKYQASTEGRIRSLDRMIRGRSPYSKSYYYRPMKGRILRPGRVCKNGHVSVVLEHGGIGQPVHQLIMKTFVGDPPEGMEVLHNNGDPTDNRLENLRYGTRTANILDVYWQGGRWRKLSIDDVDAIRFGLTCGIKGTELAVMFNVSPSTISCIKRRKSFSWL